MIRRMLLVVVMGIALLGSRAGAQQGPARGALVIVGGGATASADTLTRRQRDSIIANSKLPQAGAVGRALGAADAAAAARRAQDSAGAFRR